MALNIFLKCFVITKYFPMQNFVYIYVVYKVMLDVSGNFRKMALSKLDVPGFV